MVRTRNPTQTRERLLEAAFGEIYEQGYTAASVDRIVERSGVTKGALYHHFGGKKELGLAVIRGTIRTMVVDSFLEPLAEAENPIDGIQACLTAKLDCITPEQVACGCPLNNLAQELSASDDDFRNQIRDLYEQWRRILADALVRGQKKGHVRTDLDASDVAIFLVAAISGTAGIAKSTRDIGVARTSVGVIGNYLDSLRATARSTDSSLETSKKD